MHSFLRTATVATASACTTALLFVACSTQNQQQQSSTATPEQAQTAPPVGSPQSGAGAAPAGASASASSGPSSLVVPARAAAQTASGGQNPAVSVYQQVGPSVVNITSLAVVRGSNGVAQPQGIGSGFFVDTTGRIVTNNHVVQDATQLNVTLQDKTTVPAQLVGRDPDNDLAVIQVDPNAQDASGKAISDRVKPVTLGDSSQVVVGETTIAIGSPLGLQQSVTEGIVSALRNPGDESPDPQAQLDILGGAIQTDASINPGNSGGPLLNASGQVIGVDSAILSQSGGNEGIGFAIPVNVVKRVIPQLEQSGNYKHPQLGISGISLSELGQQVKQQLGIPANQNGVLVDQVSDGAQQAGVQGGNRNVNLGRNQQISGGGDIIVAIDGNPIQSVGQLRGYIENNKNPGDRVTVTVLRNGQRQDVPVTLSERPPAQPTQQPSGSPLLPGR